MEKRDVHAPKTNLVSHGEALRFFLLLRHTLPRSRVRFPRAFHFHAGRGRRRHQPTGPVREGRAPQVLQAQQLPVLRASGAGKEKKKWQDLLHVVVAEVAVLQ